jgi:putative ATP-binding cassette transporter
MRAFGSVVRDAWRLASPFFRSEERRVAWLLLGTSIALNLLYVGMTVVLNYWNRAFFDSLGSKDWPAFLRLLLTYRDSEAGFMPGFVLIVSVLIPVSIYKTYLTRVLQIRWRRWMVGRMTADYLTHRAYYTMTLQTEGLAAESLQAGLGRADNPDQRIADDTRKFVEDTLTLGLDLMSNVFSLFNFAFILFGLSGVLNVFGVPVPGYLLWVVILYAIIGTWLAHVIGRPLPRLEFRQQKAEADFRFALVRLRENTEGVALLGGEEEERASLASRFGQIYGNWIALSKRQKLQDSLIAGYDQVASIFPFVVASPRYFSGEILLGGLTQTAGAFARVQMALSWFLEQYQSLAGWRATVARLTGFQDAVRAAQAAAASGLAVTQGGGADLALEGVTLRLPDGTPLLDHASIGFTAGRSAVITGRSGTGKSTLFRALAGIWPFGSGTVRRPAGTSLSLPQRPYIPLGTLRHAICYPAPQDSFPDAAIKQALSDVGLSGLTSQLDADEPWPQRLSGGEQQRLAIARALLLRPDWLFMDEATASLDPEAEAELYALLRRQLTGTTIVSIAHRPAVAAFHDEARVFRRRPGEPGTLEAAKQPELAAAPSPSGRGLG